MLSFNGHAAFKARVTPTDPIYADLKASPAGNARFALYYRGYLVWRDADGWALSKAELVHVFDRYGVYRQIGDAKHGTYAFGFRTRRETLEAIDRRETHGPLAVRHAAINRLCNGG